MKIFTNANSLLLILASCFILSCSTDSDSRVCTGEFVVHYLTVLTPGDEPADAVQIEVSNKETGEIYNVCEDDSICGPGEEDGRYVIFHDGFLGEVNSDGEEVIVEGFQADSSFTEEFVFGDDGCHIQKYEGPDQVYLSPD